MQQPFAKYEGAGNDFILIDNRNGGFLPGADLVARLCDRHFGIGADGLMTLRTLADGRCSMRYFNADGSEGEMCGNGARCFALFARHLGIFDGEEFRFDAADGPHTARVRAAGASAGEVEVRMREVRQIVAGDGWWSLDTGVPHYVEFTEAVAAADVSGRGRQIRRDTARFPAGTNVNFAEVIAPGSLRVRTYERGVEAETLACGTGATAAAIVANYAFQHDICRYDVEVPGGRLSVRFAHEKGSACYSDIRLTGPARRVFGGEFDRDNF